MSPDENAYGRRKRLQFVAAELANAGVATVLDVGCGTGTELTLPLARRLPDVRFVAVDDDSVSILHAQAQPDPGNVEFRCAGLPQHETFDAVILSEVIEHVPDPGGFLRAVAGRVRDGGILILTTPNGYGPFEWSQTVESLLWWCGLLGLMRRAKRRYVGSGAGPAASDTLAVSPHLNFFTRSQVERLMREAGLEPVGFRPRTFLCGFGFDHVLKGSGFYRWNAGVTDRLPGWMASAWMFVGRKSLPPAAAPEGYRRNGWARFRRRLNERRWGVA
ncbi:MAG: methyltransferase domain-containing protein [Acetobacterales bacterium]